MLFNSLEFVLFLPIVLLLYWFGTRRNIRVQNILDSISYFRDQDHLNHKGSEKFISLMEADIR